MNQSEATLSCDGTCMQVAPQKSIRTWTADSSVLRMECVFVNTAFTIVPSVRTVWGTPYAYGARPAFTLDG